MRSRIVADLSLLVEREPVARGKPGQARLNLAVIIIIIIIIIMNKNPTETLEAEAKWIS